MPTYDEADSPLPPWVIRSIARKSLVNWSTLMSMRAGSIYQRYGGTRWRNAVRKVLVSWYLRLADMLYIASAQPWDGRGQRLGAEMMAHLVDGVETNEIYTGPAVQPQHGPWPPHQSHQSM